MNEFKPAASNEDSPFPVEPTEQEKPVQPTTKASVVTTEMLSSATCRWPIGDPTAKDFHYCGDQPLSGGIYCDTHDAVSRAPSQRKR